MKLGLLTLLVFFVFTLSAQKKIIDHTAYNDWNSIVNYQISNDGDFISYEIKPHRGDGYLYIYNAKTERLDSIYRATKAHFSGESNYLVFRINPGFDTLRTVELEDIDKEEWPQDTLAIYLLNRDSLITFTEFNSYSLSEKTDWMVIEFNENGAPEKKKRGFCKRKKKESVESDGVRLMSFNPITGEQSNYNNVIDYDFSEEGNYLTFITHEFYEVDSLQLSVLNPVKNTLLSIHQKYVDIVSVRFNKQESKLAFLSSMDTIDAMTYQLQLFDLETEQLSLIADTNTTLIEKGKTVSDFFDPEFTSDGKYLFFGVAEQPKEEPKDTLIDSEKVNLDIWHYKDTRLQPQQLLEKRWDEFNTDLYVYHLQNKTIIQLSSDTLDVYYDTDLKGNRLEATSNEQYAFSYNWTLPYGKEDHYMVDITNGQVSLVKSGVEQGGNLSPTGKYYTYYKNETSQYYLINLDNSIETCITCNTTDVSWGEDVNGQPIPEYILGTIGWSKNDNFLYIQSRYDVWEFNPSENKLTSITNQYGRQNKVKLKARKWSYDSTFVDFDNYYLTGFDEKTKSQSFYIIDGEPGASSYIEIANFAASIVDFTRSKDKSRYAFRKMTFIDYPELFTYSDDIQSAKQISVTNQQQNEYNWGTVELIKWTSYDGQEVEGLLYKPEDFDESKNYPLMVYFYERYTDNIHRHYIPKPTASIVYPTEYVSAGYVFFIPNIEYKAGHPAQSAYDCILSGTDRVLALLPNVDSNRMALQGQSWGGYQTAQLVTMTNRYKAAMAGAPVTNMFSAYGGIRWGSGLNRQFQYENTQSRIGYTIWERPDLYIENSPQFHLPNVTTPLLIMHNDGDGAVPWYQGIELFTGLKRLGKEAWLLNYNGEEHNLMQNANRIDLSIRMRQFFDYYLMDKEAPEWLLYGIPALKKGKELRY